MSATPATADRFVWIGEDDDDVLQIANWHGQKFTPGEEIPAGTVRDEDLLENFGEKVALFANGELLEAGAARRHPDRVEEVLDRTPEDDLRRRVEELEQRLEELGSGDDDLPAEAGE